jgi:hypothetical protein
VALLSPEEVRIYQRLRGYDNGHQGHHHGGSPESGSPAPS